MNSEICSPLDNNLYVSMLVYAGVCWCLLDNNLYAGVYCFLTGHSTLKLLRFSCSEMYGMVKMSTSFGPVENSFFFF